MMFSFLVCVKFVVFLLQEGYRNITIVLRTKKLLPKYKKYGINIKDNIISTLHK